MTELVAALRELHSPTTERTGWPPFTDMFSNNGPWCIGCNDLTDEYMIAWPCPTIQLIDNLLKDNK